MRPTEDGDWQGPGAVVDVQLCGRESRNERVAVFACSEGRELRGYLELVLEAKIVTWVLAWGDMLRRMAVTWRWRLPGGVLEQKMEESAYCWVRRHCIDDASEVDEVFWMLSHIMTGRGGWVGLVRCRWGCGCGLSANQVVHGEEKSLGAGEAEARRSTLVIVPFSPIGNARALADIATIQIEASAGYRKCAITGCCQSGNQDA